MSGGRRSPGLGIWLRRLAAMTRKELLLLLRDPVLLFVIFYGFTFDVYNAASGVTLQLKSAAVAVFDLDRSAASRELAGRLQPPQFVPLAPLERGGEGQKLLDRGQALMVLSVPPGFSRDLAAGRTAPVQLQIDATNTALATLGYADATQIITQFGLEQALRRQGISGEAAAELPQVENRVRVWFNPNQEDAWFMGISEMLNVVTAFAILLTAALMVREKERGTIEQLLVSPLSALQITAPKVIAMVIMIHIGISASLLLVLEPLFDVPIRGSLLLFALVTTLYIVTLSGLGLLIATLTRNLAQAAMLGILVLAPMMFLSGVWTPPEAMPPAVRMLVHISPLYYYSDAGYAILLKGAGLDVIWPSVLGIAGLGVLIVASGLSRFRRQFG